MQRVPRLARRSALAAAVLGAVVPTSDGRGHEDKLPIYSSPPPELVLVEAPSELEKQIGVARRTVTKYFREGHSQVQGVVSRWIGVEHAVEHRVKSFKSPSENITPGALYVGVATLTGSIFARNRIWLTRIFIPPAAFVLSMHYFLPQTTDNITTYLSSLEEVYLPSVHEKRQIAVAHSSMTWEKIKDATASGRETLNDGVETGVTKLQELTGLKFREAYGWGKHVAHAAEDKALDLKVKAEKKVEEVTAKLEKNA